ncbi:MAG TPA: CYTH domain-containing protein [Candidatus Bathyarchaeia archaeon]|nr:CYTH domain-containing protein [Candidatus Bathyarchaeia archaeon]
MAIEYEATFANINKNRIRSKLKNMGAKLVKAEFMQKRIVFHLPKGHEIKGGWLRVRDESDKITLSLKIVIGDGIENQNEICLKIDNFEEAVKLLEQIGCRQKAYQESKREIWEIDGVEVTIDEWPFLEPYVEVEGTSEEAVKNMSDKLGFDYSEAIFDSVDYLYSKKYNISKDIVNNSTPRIVFGKENPFQK